MKDNPIISIIVPSYNHGKFLEKCLESIINQTFLNYEVIIQDNNSSDNTKSILKKYQKFKNFHIYIESDDGQADAINKGILKAKGEWLTWQNCDDYYFDNEVLEKIYEEIISDKKKKYGLFYGNINLVYLEENYESELRFYGVNYFTLIHEGMVISNQSSFWKKNIHSRYGYLKKFRVNFDYEWFLRISQHIKFKKIKYKKPIASFSIYRGQQSYNYSQHDNLQRSRIVKIYLKKFNISQNFITLFFLKKLSKLFRFSILIINSDLPYFFKKIFLKFKRLSLKKL